MSNSRAEVNSHLFNKAGENTGISAEYVIAHAARQSRHGKNPSVSFKGVVNPREALKAAHAYIRSATVEKPAEVLDFEYGSVIAWTRNQEPDRDVAFVALEKLTDAPVEVRARFVDELAQEYADHDDITQGEDPRAVALRELAYIAGYYEPADHRQKIYAAWQEVDPSFEHPMLGRNLA